MILPGATGEAAMKIGESIREAVLALRMEHEGSSVNDFVTVSIGVCSRKPEIGEGPEAMLRDADTALYVAKSTGRNRVMMAGQMPVQV